MGCLWSEQLQHSHIKIKTNNDFNAIKLGPKRERGLIDQEEVGPILTFCHFSTTNKATISCVGDA